MLDLTKINKAIEKREAARPKRLELKIEAGQKLPPIASDILLILQAYKSRRASTVRISEIGHTIEAAGGKYTKEERFLLATVILKDHFKLRELACIRGRMFEMPDELPEITDGVVTRVAAYKPEVVQDYYELEDLAS